LTGIVLKDNVPFVMCTDRLLCVDCCQCGKRHYWSFKMLTQNHIEITVNSKVDVVQAQCAEEEGGYDNATVTDGL
jgi:hypothetical protein